RSSMLWVVKMLLRQDWLYISLRVMHWLSEKPTSRPRVVMLAAGTEEEKAKNFQWGLRRSILNHLMCMSYTYMAQVSNAARNYEILHERDDDDTERPDKRQKSGDRHQPTSQKSSHRNHGHNNDCHGSDRNSSTLFIYEHAVFMLFDTGATHSVISSAFASRITTTPTLLDHVLCISTPMRDS
nr:hypothetical protein [Tanacetum cinerariifolium]